MNTFRTINCILVACAGLSAVPAAWSQAPDAFSGGISLRYRDGVALHERGDERGAFRAYLEAGEAGYGPAQRRLGEIYDKGDGVQRDYQSSLKWYQKAREQGLLIPAPIVHSPR